MTKIRKVAFAGAVAVLALGVSITRTWSQGVGSPASPLDARRVGVVEQVFRNVPATGVEAASHPMGSTWARVAVSDNGYGFVGHIEASVPESMRLKSGDRVEVALADGDLTATADHVVRVLAAPR